MRLLELCSGENSSWSKAGRALGYECTTLDWNPKCGADIIMDVRNYVAPAERSETNLKFRTFGKHMVQS